MRNAKIVYVVGGLYSPNGMSSVLSQKINYLARHTNYEIHIILTERPEAPFCYTIDPSVQIVNFNLNFDQLDTLPLLKKVYHYFNKQRKYKKLFSKYLMQVRPDITVSAMRREINFLHKIHDGSKKVGEIHFNKQNYRNITIKWLPQCLNQAISNYWMNDLVKKIQLLDQFIVLSHEDKAKWTNITNIEVIHNPLTFYPTQASDCSSKKIIAVGRYTYQKGFDMLADIWQKVSQQQPDWELHIYGNGDRAYYQHIADAAGIGQSFICHEASRQIGDKYRESSIFVLSSRFEGMPMVIAEAMSCGLPVISFACPCGPKDTINDQEDGFLIPIGDIDYFAEKLCYLITYEEIRKKMGEQARMNVRRFKEEIIMQQWIDLFNKLIK